MEALLTEAMLQALLPSCFKAVPTIFPYNPFYATPVAVDKIELAMKLWVEKDTVTQHFYLLQVSFLIPKSPLCLAISITSVPGERRARR